jgi:CDP-paratose 2-epimerase
MRVLVTGSGGLIGSEVAEFFLKSGAKVLGVDNNMRADFFGPNGDTRWNTARLEERYREFTAQALDIRDRVLMTCLVLHFRPNAVVHCAAQPSHDLAASRPYDDFDVNAGGTLNLLEATRQYRTDIPFVHMSTNKVYGDAPNRLLLKELDTRFEFDDPAYANGIDEDFSIDQSMHSIFGASKVAADVMVQEYGRYFDMPTCCLRAGCLTGPNHSGVQLHGFLSYLALCNLDQRPYRIFGYKGKQVRDNIHSLDVARFIEAFIKAPRVAQVYNIGGGRQNTVSILEAFKLCERITGIAMNFEYVEHHRKGDHICYYSNLSKIRHHYPEWDISLSVEETLRQIVDALRMRQRLHA